MVLDTSAQTAVSKDSQNALSSASSDSDSAEQKEEVIEGPELDRIECCPASPTTVPNQRTCQRSNSSGSQVRSPKPRRQRTTSVNQNTTNCTNEAIIRANHRTIYTAGRPPWYNCAGQQVEPFVIGGCIGRLA